MQSVPASSRSVWKLPEGNKHLGSSWFEIKGIQGALKNWEWVKHHLQVRTYQDFTGIWMRKKAPTHVQTANKNPPKCSTATLVHSSLRNFFTCCCSAALTRLKTIETKPSNMFKLVTTCHQNFQTHIAKEATVKASRILSKCGKSWRKTSWLWRIPLGSSNHFLSCDGPALQNSARHSKIWNQMDSKKDQKGHSSVFLPVASGKAACKCYDFCGMFGLKNPI